MQIKLKHLIFLIVFIFFIYFEVYMYNNYYLLDKEQIEHYDGLSVVSFINCATIFVLLSMIIIEIYRYIEKNWDKTLLNFSRKYKQ